ncbi:MAG: hypothetical protein ACI8PP_001676 [Candidatus Pseudothioglobus sp.]|jgi:hypothetical protein
MSETAEHNMTGINGVKEEPFSLFAENAPDWRIWFGLSVTVLWLIVLSLYIAGSIGWSNIASSPIATVGNFLEGAFAPLAFLWLVIGYFLQKKELAQNTAAIKLQYVEIQKSATQAVIQAEAISASELHARRESFLRIAESVKQQLGAIMGFLFISSQGASGSGAVSSEKISELWSKMSQNDPEVFSRSMLELQFLYDESYAYKVLFGTLIRTRHSENFIFNFERLLRAAAACDEDRMIYDSVMGSAHGYIFSRLVRLRDFPPESFVFGIYDFDPDSYDVAQ